MMQRSQLSLLIASAFMGVTLPIYAETTNEIEIEEIGVSAQSTDQKADQVFKQAGAVAIRGEEKRLQSLDSVVRALPGTFTNIDPAQGTLTVNIRGMAGFGRVNTTIDGVPQTFFGTSANGDRRFHDDDGGLPPSSQFGSMIDSNLLSSIEVHKGFSSGEKGVNALAGSAELRTLDVDDVVFKGNKVGVRSKFSYGTNQIGYSGMLALAGKTEAFSETGSVGALFAYAQRQIGSNYKRGDGTYAKENAYVKRMDQKPSSWLAKFELNPTETHRILFGGREYRSNIGGRDLINRNYSVKYHYTPESDWVDLELLAARNDSIQRYDDDSSLWQLTDASTKNLSQYLNLKNSSYFSIWNSDLTLTYGGGYFTNRYARKAQGINNDNLAYTPFSPSGKQQILSSFLSSKWKKDIYTLENNFTYTRSIFTGFKPDCGNVGKFTVPCFPRGAHNIKMVHYSVDPSVQLSAELSDWFAPFISASRSKRMPNIQEVFFNNENGGSMNPYLKPETAKTYQIGFNTFKQDWLSAHDQLGIKLLYYRSTIKNYITSESFYISNSGNFTTNINDVGSGSFHAQISLNSPTPVKTNGVELEASYENDHYFGRLTYSYEQTSQPVGVQSSVDGFGFGDIYELPKHYGTLDLGGRLFDKTLTLGTILKYTGKAKRFSPKGKDIDTGIIEKQDLPSRPVIVDLYALYEINKNIQLKFSVQNALDALYIDPLNSQNTTRSQHVSSGANGEGFTYTNYARGRTYLFGGEVRF